jgi:NADH dehydrogenase
MAGSVAELARHALVRDFRRVRPQAARILLVEAGPRILPTFPEDLSKHAHDRLERLGVTVWTGRAVEDIAPGRVRIAGEWIEAGTIVWGAGVQASPATHWIPGERDRLGRILVAPDLSVPGIADVFVIGDLANCRGTDGKPLPGLAQVANQQGLHLGAALAANFDRGAPLPPFEFHDRGNTAIIGRNAAVFDFGRWHLKGFFGWVLWALVHVYLLVGFEQRLLVSLQWFWAYITYQRGARLILPSGERRTTADPSPEP